MKKNTTPNNLYWNSILKFGKIQTITYIHNQNEFLIKILPKPIKTPVKQYIYDYYTKYIEIYMQNIKWLVLLSYLMGNYVQMVPPYYNHI